MNNITLGVFRRMNNRTEGLPDDSSYALELHQRRKEALHEVFDNEKGLEVLEWGGTDDDVAHELVTLALAVKDPLAVDRGLPSFIKEVGEKLAEAGVDKSWTGAGQWLIAKLWPKQKEKKILDFHIQFPGGTRIKVDPPDSGELVTISFHDGRVIMIEYGAPPDKTAAGKD